MSKEQLNASSSMLGSPFELIPPLSKDFRTCGTRDITERARQWALDREYVLYKGGPDQCAHGLLRMECCPNFGMCQSFGFDHTQIWVPDYINGSSSRNTPFILTQPYQSEIPETLIQYARAHGLTINSGWYGDNWYGHGTMAIRLTIGDNWPLWPIERDALIALHTQPITWENN